MTKTSSRGYDLTPPAGEERARLEADLNPEERRVLLSSGTESPFCGGLLSNKEPGVYECRLCSLPLFESGTKFESRTGWPSFHTSFDEEHVARIEDRTHGMARVEIRCGRCGGHLGHVFDDGPRPTGERFCLNSAALKFAPA